MTFDTGVVRKMRVADIAAVLGLILEFRREALDNTSVSFDEATLRKRFTTALADESPIILIAEDGEKVVGMIAGILLSSYFDDGQFWAVEVMWYVSKEHRGTAHGKRLLEAFEKWAKEHGAHRVIMIAGHYSVNTGGDALLDRYYKRQGYRRLETYYMKDVPSGE